MPLSKKRNRERMRLVRLQLIASKLGKEKAPQPEHPTSVEIPEVYTDDYVIQDSLE